MEPPAQKAAEPSELDAALLALKDRSKDFARTPPEAKARALREAMGTLARTGEEWVKAAARAKDGLGRPGEEWLSGPVIVMRNLRLLAEQLEVIAAGAPSRPTKDRVRTREDGRVEVEVLPASVIESAVRPSLEARQLMQAGVTVAAVEETQGSFYRESEPQGGLSLVLGTGCLSAAPATDALYQCFAEGRVTLVKMSPINAWAAPWLERALAPLISRGWLEVKVGDRDAGEYLVAHNLVDHVHITGSQDTHESIVWGPPGRERERRKSKNEPCVPKPVTSQLSSVSPVAIVPTEYTAAELEILSRSVAGMVTYAGGYTCASARLLFTSRGWKQREVFFARLGEVLGKTPTRRTYDAQTRDRYLDFIRGREIRRFGDGEKGHLDWTLVTHVEARHGSDPAFATEPFCPVLSETQLEAREPEGFLSELVPFLNDVVQSSLHATIFLPERLEGSRGIASALDQLILGLRYGTVAINQWAGLAYGLVSPAWGGHPSSTLADPKSGIGWVHNTGLLGGIDKTLLRGPLVGRPKPLHFADHSSLEPLAKRMFAFEQRPSWLLLPGLALSALFA